MNAHDVTRLAKGILVDRTAGEFTTEERTFIEANVARHKPEATVEATEAMVQQVGKAYRIQQARVQLFLEVRKDRHGFWAPLVKDEDKKGFDAYGNEDTLAALMAQKDAGKAERAAAKAAKEAAKPKKPSKPRVIVEDEDGDEATA